MTNSRLFKTTVRIQPQLNSTQTTELDTTQLKLVLSLFPYYIKVRQNPKRKVMLAPASYNHTRRVNCHFESTPCKVVYRNILFVNSDELLRNTFYVIIIISWILLGLLHVDHLLGGKRVLFHGLSGAELSLVIAFNTILSNEIINKLFQIFYIDTRVLTYFKLEMLQFLCNCLWRW